MPIPKVHLSIILLLALGSGCGLPDWGKDENAKLPTPLVEIEKNAEISKLWVINAGKGTKGQFLKLTPAYAQGRVFVADNDGKLRSINAENGKTIWSIKTGVNITGGPGVSESLTMIGTDEAEALAFTSETGKKLWQVKVSSEILAAPQEADNIVVVRTIDGKIFGLNAENGLRLWVYDRSVPALTLRGTSKPIITENRVIAGFDGGQLVALELTTGKLIWGTSIALASGRSELERMVDIDSEPLVMGQDIYVVTFQGRLASVALETGQIIWTRDIASHKGLCADENTIYVTDDDDYIWALERSSGNSLWKQEKLYAREVTAPAIIGDLVVVGDFEGYLHWLDKKSGDFVARTRLSGNPIIATPITVDNVVYVYSSDGKLGAYTRQ